MAHTFACIASALFVILLIAEARFPLRERTRRYARRLVLNLAISALALAAGGLVIRPLTARLTAWTSSQPFGLLRLQLPTAVALALASRQARALRQIRQEDR